MKAAERWSRVSALLSNALDLPEAQRTEFLAEAVRAEPSLRTEVFALFDELRQAEEFLEPPAAEAPALEATLGPYRVVGKLGEGGMGVVHLAERSDGQFTRRVAIKRLAGGGPRSEALRRFREERQILARLDHPNIARLLDAGIDGAGVPYLVMEHVEGLPLTSHCREHALSLPQRLLLFGRVCGAVQHAHQRLVIHRDLKPANILVTPAGEPKLLDFGIAKVLGATPGADATHTMNRALTLDYASPEQVRGEVVTTASDVYSLGVLLYELLCDARPYEVGEGGLAEAVRLVCESATPPPSRKVSPEGRAQLEGDLDAIVRKAMEKAPAERYGSVAELAADLAAHSDHQPVKARRASPGYVARKFVRRHRAATGLAAAGVVLLAGGLGAVLWQARRAERERARAEKRFDELRQLAHYVIFDLQNGLAKVSSSTELRRQMVERSLAYLDSLASDATGDAALQLELAEAYSRLGDVLGLQSAANLGDRPAALASYGKALGLLRQAVGRSPSADARRALARLLIKLRTAHSGDYGAEASSYVVESLALWEDLVRQEPGREENARGLASASYAAYFLTPVDERARSLPHLERALALFEQLLQARPEDVDRKRNVALCHKNLAGYFNSTGDPRAYANALLAAELDAERLAAEPRNPTAKIDYSFDLSVLGDYHLNRAEHGPALERYQAALGLRRELVEADPADVNARSRLAYMLVRVGVTQVLSGRPERAAALLREGLELTSQPGTVPPGGERLVTDAHLFMGEVAAGARRDPCPSYRRMAEALRSLPADQLDDDPPIDRVRERALERLKSCPAVAS